MEGRATVCVSEVAQAGMEAKAAAAPAVGTEGAAPGGSTSPEAAVRLTDGELEELAKMAVEYRAKERAMERAKKRAMERVKYRRENAWRDVEIVVSDVVRFYEYDPSKAVPAGKRPPGPAVDAAS